MQTKLVQIGNSKGIRLPKALIEQIGLGVKIDLKVRGQQIIITPAKTVRTNWGKAFQKMAENSDDQVMDADEVLEPTKWDSQEWEW
jgi:antitoxin MazE